MRIRRQTKRIGAMAAAVVLTAGLSVVGGSLPTAAAASGCSTSTTLPWRSPKEGYGKPHHYYTRPAEKYVIPCGFGHHFWAYDYDTNAHQIDNPVTIIFVSNSTNMVGRIYDAIEDQGVDNSGDPMVLHGYGYPVKQSGTKFWSSTSHGRKTDAGDCWGQCGGGVDIHIRTYGADGSQGTQVYQSTGAYRYYVLATTHFDIDEGSGSAHFGYNDHARAILVSHMVSVHKWTVVGKTYVANSCYGWFDKSHYCDSDGYAVLVRI